MLPLQGAQVGSPVGELRSHKLHGMAKKKEVLYICGPSLLRNSDS